MTALCTYAQLSTQYPLIICPLPQFQLIEITGEDAQKFLQGQLTCDVNKLAIGENTLCAHCDPKGKVWSIFYLIKCSEQHFYLLIRNHLLPSALDQLKKYAVFSKVRFEPCNRKIIGAAGGNAHAFISQFITAPNSETPLTQTDEFMACLLASEQPRFILLAPATWQPHTAYTHDEHIWDVLDMQDGIPVLTAESQNEFIPQALNLQHLGRAISFQKGCYIGQETIARAKYRGANKRALFTLMGHGKCNAHIGDSVEIELAQHWRKTGHILNLSTHNDTQYLQVVLAKDTPLNAKFRVDDLPYSLLPLPYNVDDK
ncbi:tRNA-modifying protein YgfZ [Spirabiliibacterium falconis]|uniref:tRNA-modifying protein YgfZ n=1 Tax=Spirabiliibacterium falconis TaxID=572023 RepID=UPI001AACCB1F|nr:tRNA-modifying protein YgfZ [Spirabiliibacterium falconis]